MEEKLYKIKKGSEFNFYSTEPSATINKIVGKTTQETREGYNILKHYYNKGFTYTINGMTFTINDDYSVTINGTATGDAFFNLNNVEGYYTQITEGETYTAYTGVANEGLSFALKTLDNTLLIYSTNVIQKSYVSTYSGNTCMYLKVTSGYTLNNLTVYPMLVKGTEITEYEPYGAMPSIDYPSPISSITNIDYKITGKNKAAANVETRTVSGVTTINNGDGTYTLNGTTTQERSFGLYTKEIGKEINLKKGKTYKLVVKEFSGSKTGGSVTSAVTKETGEMVYNYITQYSPVVTATYNSVIEFINLYVAKAGITFNNYKIGIMLIENGQDEEFEPYKEKTTTITLPQGVELCGKDNFQDSIDSNGVITKKLRILKFDGTENWIFNNTYNCFSLYMNGEVINKNFFPISNYFVEKAVANLQTEYGMYSRWSAKLFIGFPNSTLEEFKNWLVEKNAEGKPLEILYQPQDPTTYNLSETEIKKMKSFPVIIGENNLTGPSETTLLYYDERTEEEQIQPITITNSGKLMPFGLTIDYNKTNLPLIAEAIEAAQTITGADGELVLDTTYGSRPFEIDAYTDDFLTPEEKEAKREEIREFLNSIKKVNTKLIIEPLNRTFEVKYAGLAEDTNLPKCVEFLIPLKSASSYAISNTTYTLDGEGELDSNTKEPTGFICTISGEAAYPELSINGYLMSYNNVILNGEQLIIDTRKCTVTKINKVGTKTNAMAYYNHQFPKIQNGTNIVSIISGIENSNLKIEWNDLFL